jgi:hypothetical protein
MNGLMDRWSLSIALLRRLQWCSAPSKPQSCHGTRDGTSHQARINCKSSSRTKTMPHFLTISSPLRRNRRKSKKTAINSPLSPLTKPPSPIKSPSSVEILSPPARNGGGLFALASSPAANLVGEFLSIIMMSFVAFQHSYQHLLAHTYKDFMVRLLLRLGTVHLHFLLRQPTQPTHWLLLSKT